VLQVKTEVRIGDDPALEMLGINGRTAAACDGWRAQVRPVLASDLRSASLELAVTREGRALETAIEVPCGEWVEAGRIGKSAVTVRLSPMAVRK
jgi:hypothetical protein